MNTTPLSSSTPVTLHETTTGSRRAPVWGAILGGAVAAIGTHILLMMLLTAIGLGVSLREVRSLGWRAFLAAAVVALAVCSVSVLAVSWFADPPI